MDIPIRLKFFKKLELYQEIIRQNKKAKKTEKKAWDMGKCILRWAAEEHHHLDSPIKRDKIKDILHKNDFATSQIDHIDRMLGTLGRMGYADIDDRTGETINNIKILQDGLIMGEVIRDTDSLWGEFKYLFWIYIIWVAIFAAIFAILYNVVKIVVEDILLLL